MCSVCSPDDQCCRQIKRLMISLRKYTSATNFPQITAGGKEELQALVQALSLNLITMPSPSSLRTSGERIDIIFPTSGSQSVYVRPAFLSRTALSRPRSLKVFLCPTLTWQIRCLAVVVIFLSSWTFSHAMKVFLLSSSW